ncbi:hypothetical protein VPHK479_0115 [Vibrio phage K479]
MVLVISLRNNRIFNNNFSCTLKTTRQGCYPL